MALYYDGCSVFDIIINYIFVLVMLNISCSWVINMENIELALKSIFSGTHTHIRHTWFDEFNNIFPIWNFTWWKIKLQIKLIKLPNMCYKKVWKWTVEISPNFKFMTGRRIGENVFQKLNHFFDSMEPIVVIAGVSLI